MKAARTRDVEVLRWVLPLPDRADCGHAGEKWGAHEFVALLAVSPPQRGGAFNESGQRRGVPTGPGKAHADVIEAHRSAQALGENIADQVGRDAAWTLPAQPPNHRGVVIAHLPAPKPSSGVHARGQADP